MNQLLIDIRPQLFSKMKELADNLATISPALKNTITSPPKNKGANKSFVSKRGQSIMIPIVAKLNINKIPKINTRLLGNQTW